jgi:hypothetical protein
MEKRVGGLSMRKIDKARRTVAIEDTKIMLLILPLIPVFYLGFANVPDYVEGYNLTPTEESYVIVGFLVVSSLLYIGLLYIIKKVFFPFS